MKPTKKLTVESMTKGMNGKVMKKTTVKAKAKPAGKMSFGQRMAMLRKGKTKK